MNFYGFYIGFIPLIAAIITPSSSENGTTALKNISFFLLPDLCQQYHYTANLLSHSAA